MFDAVRQLASRVEGDWRAHGTAYELVRVLTAPARRGLVRLRVEEPVHGREIARLSDETYVDEHAALHLG